MKNNITFYYIIPITFFKMFFLQFETEIFLYLEKNLKHIDKLRNNTN